MKWLIADVALALFNYCARQKKVSDVKYQIKKLTQRLMSTVAELAVTQANAGTLQAMVNIESDKLKQAQEKMTRGEAPSEEIEADWLKYCDRERRMIDMLSDKVIIM